MNHWLIGCALAATAFVSDSASAAGARMVFPGKQWEEATPESQDLDGAKLKSAIAWLEKNAGRDGVKELVIIRHGRLVWQGPASDNRHGIWSCTKSFTSTVLGVLIDDGRCTLDTKAAELVKELAARYPQLTLRHLTTMTSGYRAVGDEPKGTYRHGPSATPFRPDTPLFSPPGARYAYWDSAMNLFGLVLTRIAREPIRDLFQRRIAGPIGLPGERWRWGDRGKVEGLVVHSGSGNAGGHVVISARDLARLGHLFLNQGRWEGKQLLSRRWVEQATRVQVAATTPWAHPESDIDGRGVYGFNWWVNGKKATGQRKWPGAPEDSYAALGHNNNALFVVPSWNLVVVRLGLDQRDRVMNDAVWSEFFRQVGLARKEKG